MFFFRGPFWFTYLIWTTHSNYLSSHASANCVSDQHKCTSCTPHDDGSCSDTASECCSASCATIDRNISSIYLAQETWCGTCLPDSIFADGVYSPIVSDACCCAGANCDLGQNITCNGACAAKDLVCGYFVYSTNGGYDKVRCPNGTAKVIDYSEERVFCAQLSPGGCPHTMASKCCSECGGRVFPGPGGAPFNVCGCGRV